MIDMASRPCPPSRHRQQGAVAILFLVTLVLTLGSLLAGLDLARVQLAQARLQASLDAGVDSALQQYGPDPGRPEADWRDVIEPWLLSLYPASGFVQSELTGNLPELDITGERLVAEVSGNINLVSAGLLDIASADLLARRVVTFQSIDREVVLAIDVSTLTDSGPDPVRDAAAALASQLLQAGTRVAIVPFSDTANLDLIDPNGDTWLDPAWKNEPWFEDVWRGCVSEIGIDQAIPTNFIAWPGSPGALAPMAARVFETYEFVVDDSIDGYHQNLRLSDEPAEINETNSTEVIEAVYDYDDIISGEGGSLTLEMVLPAPENCLDTNAILPFSDNISTIAQTINQLTPDPDSSLLPVGLLWAWRVMNSAPPGSSLNTPRRAIVLISDGRNQPADPSDETTAVVDEIFINITIPTLWCPGNSGCTGNVPGGQVDSYTLTGSIDVIANVARQEVTSLNTDGPEIATGRSQTAVWDLNAYTTTICDNLRLGMGSEEIELHALTFGTPPDAWVVANCVGYSDPQRNRQFNASNWATVVNDTVADLTSAP